MIYLYMKTISTHVFMFDFFCCIIMSLHTFFQHGRSDSYRVATFPNVRDDNKTADGMYKVL